MFYVVCESLAVRTGLIERLKAAGVLAVFHYQSLHASHYFASQHDGRALPHADRYTDCLLRLPLFFELSDDQVDQVCDVILRFFGR